MIELSYYVSNSVSVINHSFSEKLMGKVPKMTFIKYHLRLIFNLHIYRTECMKLLKHNSFSENTLFILPTMPYRITIV